MQGAPTLEVHASIAGLLATYDDAQGPMADAADTHLGLHIGPLSIGADVYGNALSAQVCSYSCCLWSNDISVVCCNRRHKFMVRLAHLLPGTHEIRARSQIWVMCTMQCSDTCLQAKCGALQLDDKSRYTVLPPCVWGLIPRLASQIRIEQINAILEQTAGQGFAISVELLDCETVGFQGEPGNFICRSAFCATLEIAAVMSPFSQDSCGALDIQCVNSGSTTHWQEKLQGGE